jgi:hypothetical protein
MADLVADPFFGMSRLLVEGPSATVTWSVCVFFIDVLVSDGLVVYGGRESRPAWRGPRQVTRASRPRARV